MRPGDDTALENTAGGAPGLLRQLNLRAALRAVREDGPLSRAELGRRTGLSRPTIVQVVGELMASGYITEMAESPHVRQQRPGPQARLLRFRANAGYVLGIDVGADKALVKLANLDGEVIRSERVRTRHLRTADEIIARIRTAVRDCAAALPAGATIRAAAIGSPGVIDQAAKTVRLAPQLPGWQGLRLAEALLGTDPGYPVATENEMQLAVLGEQRWGAARGAADVVYVGLGVGVGAGILLGGQLHRGFRGAAGEIGYLPIPEPLAAPADERSPGAFERAVGAYGWQHRDDELGSGPAADPIPSQADNLAVFAAARAGDEAALKLVGEITEILARGIASVCLLLDPQTIIMGGGLSGAGPVLFDPLRERTARLIPGDPVPIIPAELGDEAVVLGAVRRAAELSDELLYNSELGLQEA